jgi:glycosyltransferase involved in cell wall biosynthesis
MLPTYKSSHFLRTALSSVLEQASAPHEMQIEVIDDGSPDDASRRIVDEVGGGRVAHFRKPQNEGLVANFNTCIERATGHYVHILHDDDAVLPGFYQTFGRALDSHPEVGAGYGRYVVIDASERWNLLSDLDAPTSGPLPNPPLALACRNRVRTPSVVVRRSLYERVGGFNPRLSHTADWEMWVRLAVNTSIWYEVQPLALYRSHSSSDTSRLVQTGENIRELRRCAAVFEEYLPSDIRKGCVALAQMWAGKIALRQVRAFAIHGAFTQAAANMGEALRCVPRPAEAVLGFMLELQSRIDRRRRFREAERAGR